MRIILSPAKKMRQDEEFLYPVSMPYFLDQTEELLKTLKALPYEELKKVWNCSDKLVEENWQRLQQMDIHQHLTPALLAYEGIAYQYMGPTVFTQRQFQYVEDHLRIVSGFYGLLKPMDGVTPYRLEMGARLRTETAADLYGFWGSRLSERLSMETNLIVNLASKEYSKAVLPQLPSSVQTITCVFAQRKAGKLVEQSTACKMARGDMVRFLAEEEICNPEDIKNYDHLSYHFVPDESGTERYVFLKEEQ